MALPSDGSPGARVMSLLVPRSDLLAGWVACKQSTYLACCRQAIETKDLPPARLPWGFGPSVLMGEGRQKVGGFWMQKREAVCWVYRPSREPRNYREDEECLSSVSRAVAAGSNLTPIHYELFF